MKLYQFLAVAVVLILVVAYAHKFKAAAISLAHKFKAAAISLAHKFKAAAIPLADKFKAAAIPLAHKFEAAGVDDSSFSRSGRALLLFMASLYLVNVLLRLPGIFQEMPPFSFCDEDIYTRGIYEMYVRWSWTPNTYLGGGANFYPAFRCDATRFAYAKGQCPYGRR